MVMVSFPNYKPVYSAQRNDLSVTVPLQFGDGYEQRFSFGFSLTPQEWDLTFAGVDSEIDEIDSFLSLRALDGVPFEWITPEDNSLYTWICKSWKKEKFDFNASRITAKFEQRGFAIVWKRYKYYTVFPNGVNGGSTGWQSIANYYPAIRTIDYDNPPWTLYIPGATTNYGRELAWPGQVKLCMGSGAIGGYLAQYWHVNRATGVVTGNSWKDVIGSISDYSCYTIPGAVIYGFSDDSNASVPTETWPGVSNL